MVRAIAGLMMVIAASADEEYHHTQLLQTRTVVRDQASTMRAKVDAAGKRLPELFRQPGAPTPTDTEPICGAVYGPGPLDACHQCVLGFHKDEQFRSTLVAHAEEGDMEGAFEFIFSSMDACLDPTPNLLVPQCDDVGLGDFQFTCFACSMMAECRPLDCSQELPKLPGPMPPASQADVFGMCVEMMAEGAAHVSLAQKLPKLKKPPCPKEHFADACAEVFPHVDGGKCAQAGCDAVAKVISPDVAEKCEADEGCYQKVFFDMWTEGCGAPSVFEMECQKALDLAGNTCKVDLEECCAVATNCEACDAFPPSEDCAHCVGENYECDASMLQKNNQTRTKKVGSTTTALRAMLKSAKLKSALTDLLVKVTA